MRGSYKERKYTLRQIQDMEQRLKNYEISVKQLMKEESIGLDRLKKEFEMAGIKFPKIPPGKRAQAPTQEEINSVVSYRNKFNVGYQRCAFALSKKGISSISARKCRAIYELEGLFLYEHEFKEKDEERIRYAAKMVGQIWHSSMIKRET